MDNSKDIPSIFTWYLGSSVCYLDQMKGWHHSCLLHISLQSWPSLKVCLGLRHRQGWPDFGLSMDQHHHFLPQPYLQMYFFNMFPSVFLKYASQIYFLLFSQMQFQLRPGWLDFTLPTHYTSYCISETDLQHYISNVFPPAILN